MRPGFLEIRLALGIDQRGSGVGKGAGGIDRGRMTLRFHEDRPARTEAAEGIVEAAGNGDQLSGHGAVEVRPPKAGGALEAAILVEHDAGADQRCPGQEVGKAAVAIAVFGEAHHRCVPLRP
ncbi:hypothetical protein D3C80_1335040 [compost metagenome]